MVEAYKTSAVTEKGNFSIFFFVHKIVCVQNEQDGLQMYFRKTRQFTWSFAECSLKSSLQRSKKIGGWVRRKYIYS